MLLTITACGGDEDTDNVIKQVQLEKTGVNTLIQSSTDQNTIYQVSVLNPRRCIQSTRNNSLVHKW